CGLGVVPGGVGQPLLDVAVVVGQKDVVPRKNAPDVALAAVGVGWARLGGQVRGGVDNVLVVAQKVPTGCTALAGGNEMLVRAIRVHEEDLVAPIGRPGGLKNKPLAVGRPIGLGILPAARELADVVQVVRLRRGESG